MNSKITNFKSYVIANKLVRAVSEYIDYGYKMDEQNFLNDLDSSTPLTIETLGVSGKIAFSNLKKALLDPQTTSIDWTLPNKREPESRNEFNYLTIKGILYLIYLIMVDMIQIYKDLKKTRMEAFLRLYRMYFELQNPEENAPFVNWDRQKKYAKSEVDTLPYFNYLSESDALLYPDIFPNLGSERRPKFKRLIKYNDYSRESEYTTRDENLSKLFRDVFQKEILWPLLRYELSQKPKDKPLNGMAFFGRDQFEDLLRNYFNFVIMYKIMNNSERELFSLANVKELEYFLGYNYGINTETFKMYMKSLRIVLIDFNFKLGTSFLIEPIVFEYLYSQYPYLVPSVRIDYKDFTEENINSVVGGDDGWFDANKVIDYLPVKPSSSAGSVIESMFSFCF
jgi:hypothetical protein